MPRRREQFVLVKLGPRSIAHMVALGTFGGWASFEWGLKDIRTGVAIAVYAIFAVYDRWKTEKDVSGIRGVATGGDAKQQEQIDGLKAGKADASELAQARRELAELRGFVKAKLGALP